ncbi:MAG TPA: YdiU family protein [Polyangia bacterium]|nr:YdiU family protein [Polyangia bacterium]
MISPEGGAGRVHQLDQLPFDNRLTAELPADSEASNQLRQVHGAAFSRVRPTPVAKPTTLAWSPEVADLLRLDPALCESTDFAQVFAGNRVPAGADPFAACYGGHQFGSWAGQLGDGRAIALGEVLDRDGGHQTLQLKGAGVTPYSRRADGRAVLRSSLREFLCSEAMHHLGIPTTRALSLVTTGESVVRDMLYDGNPQAEPGAVVCRVAPSFTRFGTFELPAARRDEALLRRLVEFTLRADFPALAGSGPLAGPEMVARWFADVCERTARLLVDWMRVGFVHGVLNTDNMSVLGLTIDYGPYGWLESYDPTWTPNTTDAEMRRYRYEAQPDVAHWNLLQLGRALLPLVGQPEPLREGLERYAAVYNQRSQEMMAARLGWGAWRDDDGALVSALFETLTRTETDQVIFYRDLARVPIDGVDGALSDDALLAPLAAAWYRPDEIKGDVRDAWVAWLRAWGRRVQVGGLADQERQRRMDALNPRFVLRNYLAQEAIDAATEGDRSLLLTMMDVLRHPYDEQPGRERFAARRPEWARQRVGCSMLSCSS